MDETQRILLAADIRASTDADVIAALAIRNDTELANLYNLDSTLEVWREAVQPEEYREAMDWTEVDNLPAGKARIWEWITENMMRSFDATKANIRAGLNEAWNGTTETNLIALSKEFCSVAEKIYADTTASPATRDFVGNVTANDVGLALNANP